MALTKVSGPLLHGSNDNLGNYNINNITGAAATFTGNVSVGGTLTYDDVTNVNSVGIVTAKGGLHVGAGGTIIHALSEDNGSVGIGTDNPTQKLDVRGNGVFLNSGNDTNISIGGTVGNNNAYLDFIGDATYTDYGLRVLRNDGGANTTSDFRHRGTGAIRFIAEEAGSFQFFTSGTGASNERLSIDSNGNVIIKRGADVGNIIQMTGADTTSEILEAGIVSSHVQFTASYAAGGDNSAGFIFRTRNGSAGTAERLRITSAGYIHAGNTGHGTNKVGGQAITGQDYDPYVKILATTSNHWLAQLRSDHASGNGVFLRAGNSSSTYTLYATGYDENNPHLIVRGDGKVGIGTTIPTAKLEISHPTQTSLLRLKRTTGNAGDFVMQIGGSNPGVIFDAVGISSDFVFQTQGNEIMRLDSLNRRIGIGTAIPDQPLHLYTTEQNAIKWVSTNSDGPLVSYFHSSTHVGAIGNSKGVMSTTDVHFGIGSKSDLVFGTKPSGGGSTLERMRIKEDGEVHISDRNSANAGEHFFQAGAYGIRMNDTNSYNHWYIERNYGGFQSTPQVTLKASGHTGFNMVNPTKVIHGEDSSATETNVLAIRNYKSSVNTKPTLTFEASSSSGQGANSSIQGLAGTDAGGSNSQNDSGMKFIVRHGGSGTEREAFTIKKDGDMYFPSGQGINFESFGTPETGGSSSSTLLHDYEEGTWTPVVHQGIDGGASYSIQRGFYTKVGGLVHISFFLRFVNSATGSTGNGNHFKMAGIPYASANLSPAYSAGGVVTYTNISFNNSAQVLFNIYNNSTIMEFHSARASTAGISGANNNKELYGSITYRAES